MDENILKKYARLVVKTGINLQKDQTVLIMAPIETAYFAREIAQMCYEEGARDVVIDWNDELFSKIRFLNAPKEAFDEFPKWRKEMLISLMKKGAALVSIAASDPEVYKDVNPEILAKVNKIKSQELKEFNNRVMTNQNCWTIVSIPTNAWAKRVFQGVNEDEAIEKLWKAILKTVRVDKEDPVAAWTEHTNNLRKRMSYLNANKFKYLHYTNSIGTDLMIELPENHLWSGGAEKGPNAVEFNANMPTEEVFTLPKKDGVNGTVVSSMPLNYNGNLIDGFTLTFKEGRIVNFKAEKGYEVLKGLIETDDGSHYLGEVALVPYDSPISNLNILFYNTLFDENASCHLAIGRAYTPCLKDYEKYNEKELEELGVNNSLTHVDFMIGTKDLSIIGITADGNKIPVFIDGNFTEAVENYQV